MVLLMYKRVQRTILHWNYEYFFVQTHEALPSAAGTPRAADIGTASNKRRAKKQDKVIY